MAKPPSPDSPDLTIEVAVRDGKTMTRRSMRLSGTLAFVNSADEPLVITSTSGEPPFVEEGCSKPAARIVIPARTEKVVRLSEAYGWMDDFTYAAQIGDSEPEDPIVIIDRR